MDEVRVDRAVLQELANAHPYLTTLNLSNNGICSVSHLNVLPHLTSVDLSHNCLSTLDGAALQGVDGLHDLNLSHNKISCLADSCHQACPHLITCDLRHNQLQLGPWLHVLSGWPQLQHLHLDGNPVSQQPGYRTTISSLLPSLVTLDGQHVTPFKPGDEGEPTNATPDEHSQAARAPEPRRQEAAGGAEASSSAAQQQPVSSSSLAETPLPLTASLADSQQQSMQDSSRPPIHVQALYSRLAVQAVQAVQPVAGRLADPGDGLPPTPGQGQGLQPGRQGLNSASPQEQQPGQAAPAPPPPPGAAAGGPGAPGGGQPPWASMQAQQAGRGWEQQQPPSHLATPASEVGQPAAGHGLLPACSNATAADPTPAPSPPLPSLEPHPIAPPAAPGPPGHPSTPTPTPPADNQPQAPSPPGPPPLDPPPPAAAAAAAAAPAPASPTSHLAQGPPPATLTTALAPPAAQGLCWQALGGQVGGLCADPPDLPPPPGPAAGPLHQDSGHAFDQPLSSQSVSQLGEKLGGPTAQPLNQPGRPDQVEGLPKQEMAELEPGQAGQQGKAEAARWALGPGAGAGAAQLLQQQVQAMRQIVAVQQQEIIRLSAAQTSAASPRGRGGSGGPGAMLLTWQQALEEQSLAAAQARQQLLEQRAKWKAGMADMQQQFEAVQGLVQVLEQRSACHKVELAQAQLAAEEARQQAAAEQVSTTRMAAQLALAEAGQKRAMSLLSGLQSHLEVRMQHVDAAAARLTAYSSRLHFAKSRLTFAFRLARQQQQGQQGQQQQGQQLALAAGPTQPTYPSLLPAAVSPHPTAGPAPRPDLPTPSDLLALEVLHAEVSRLVSEREQLLQQLSQWHLALDSRVAAAAAAVAEEEGARRGGLVEAAVRERVATLQAEADQKVAQALQAAEQQAAALRREVAAAVQASAAGAQAMEAQLGLALARQVVRLQQLSQMTSQLRAKHVTSQLQLVAAQSQVENLTRQLAAAHSAAATAAVAHASELEEARQQAKDAQESCRQQVAEAARRATDAEREASKAVVLSRQLERQVARLRDKRASEAAGQVADLQAQLDTREAALRTVRRERNALLAVLRSHGIAAGPFQPDTSSTADGDMRDLAPAQRQGKSRPASEAREVPVQPLAPTDQSRGSKNGNHTVVQLQEPKPPQQSRYVRRPSSSESSSDSDSGQCDAGEE